MRKIVQIACFGVPASDAKPTGNHSITTIIALCNDGTVWHAGNANGQVYPWERFPDIPQDEDQVEASPPKV